jgi:hypothetical protein
MWWWFLLLMVLGWVLSRDYEIPEDRVVHQAYYVNLKHRLDRRNQFMKGWYALQTPPPLERTDAVYTPEEGRLGCTLSHFQCVQKARSIGNGYVLIMEDDIQWHVTGDVFTRQIEPVLKRWRPQVLFLGCSPIRLGPTTPVSEVWYVYQALSMSAYCVHVSYLDRLEGVFRRAVKQHEPHDLETQRVQARDGWMTFWPPLISQRSDYSDIERRVVDYQSMDRSVGSQRKFQLKKA